MPEKPQQQTLSVRIDDRMRRRLERAQQLSATKAGEPVSISEIAKQFLESARDDRLEVVNLLAEPTGSLLHIRRKGDAGRVLSRAEWTVLAHFVRHGLEASPRATPNPASRESVVAVLDAFLSVYDLRAEAASRLDAFYLGGLPPECRPMPGKRADRPVQPTSDAVRRTVKETRRQVSDPATTWQPGLAGRNLYVLLDEEKLPGAEDITRALRPYWSPLWRLAARGHYMLVREPVRDPDAERDGLYQLPIPSAVEGPFTLSFVRGQGHEFSVLLSLPGPRGARYPIVGYPRLVEFRAMLAAIDADHRTGDWTGAYFFADVIAPERKQPPEIWFRAHDNGITFGFSLDEWSAVNAVFRRAWEMPDVSRAWDAMALEYGEL